MQVGGRETCQKNLDDSAVSYGLVCAIDMTRGEWEGQAGLNKLKRVNGEMEGLLWGLNWVLKMVEERFEYVCFELVKCKGWGYVAKGKFVWYF